ncbi:hypothetical protein OG474_30745 [Kribbella sp. NBC_01505]|uniref:hypothetical protein n=1 Tax=Kribbella sp. NBC_01505 TaxID=2903580 RepID=UPI003869BC1C
MTKVPVPDISRLDVGVPVLLGPVRIETRFTATELLIRIFPDEWAIDKFEEHPTAAELTAIDAYWTAIWRAGGNQAAEQAAWNELVGRMAVGRAAWMLTEHPAANPADRPSGVPAGTTVLVVVSPAALPANDRGPTTTYWTSVWQAHGDRDRIRSADLALLTAVGAARADAIRRRRPSGLDSVPAGAGDAVRVAFLVLPVRPAVIAPHSWTTKAKVNLLPQRFYVFGWKGTELVIDDNCELTAAGLAVSPDPSLSEDEQLKVVNEKTGELRIPADLDWLTNFGKAVEKGMGLRITLNEKNKGGVDRLVVLGLRLQSAPAVAAGELGELIWDQLRSTDGFGLVPQGTATNNSDEAPAGQPKEDEAATSLRTAFGLRKALGPNDWKTKTDGQTFAELLGIDPQKLTGAPNADGTDQREARAANTVLWPATWGNFLQTTLYPIVPASVVEDTRDFFQHHVSGRGPIPAFKVGRQPYGILPTTSFKTMTWPAGQASRAKLHSLLEVAAADWQSAAETHVSHLGSSGDPHQVLLDILALHPTSAEYYQRYAQSVEDIYNRRNLMGGGPLVIQRLAEVLQMPQPILALLTELGYVGSIDPDLVRRLFLGDQFPLTGALVDDRPLSETDPIKGQDYLAWLASKARTDFDSIRREDGLIKKPAALLYLLARHAVMLGWEEAGRKLSEAKGRSPLPTSDPLFIHISQGAGLPSESRLRQLYSPDPDITSDPTKKLVEYIPTVLATSPATVRLREQLEALDVLTGLPTARLGRLVAEHLDTATYRLDSWRLGLVNERLAQMRFGTDGTAAAKTGVHLGAYGWLENVKPKPPAPNGGYIHAPSPNHATTAAVLRAGYMANGKPETPGAFAVNLTSERVRLALNLLDGLRQGQSLSALLGYRFERGLHDRYLEDPVELDQFIDPLRGQFPLRAGKLGAVPSNAVEEIEARNVIDGLALLQFVTRSSTEVLEYPFGLNGMPSASDPEKAAIGKEVERLLDLHDALADLAVAEGTHQALMGNTERASATLDAYAKDGFPPEPAVVQTPRSGVTLTHRFALQLTPSLKPNTATTFRGSGPRAKAEPALNAWLAKQLPAQLDIVVLVTWTDPVRKEPRRRVVTLFDLELQPIDLLWALRPQDEAAMSDLDDRIVGVVLDRDHPRPDTELKIEYTTRVPNKVTLFELSSLIATFRSLLTTSRTLRATDLVPAAGTASVDRSMDAVVALDKDRPLAVRAQLGDLRDAVTDYIGDLVSVFPAPPAGPMRPEILAEIDTYLAGYAGLALQAGAFGMTRSSWGELAAWRRGQCVAILRSAKVVAERMNTTLGTATTLITQYDGLPSTTAAEERYRRLQQIERLLTTKPTTPRPETPQKLRQIITTRRRDFADKLEAVTDLATSTETTLSGLLAEASAGRPVGDFDPSGLDLTPYGDAIVAYATELLTRAKSLQADIDARIAVYALALKAYDAAVLGPEKVEAGIDALKALLGEDVLVVPEFTPPDQVADEWRKARADSTRLVAHLQPKPYNHDFPVDDWLHGMARVREKPRLWEQSVALSATLRKPGLLGSLTPPVEPELTPIQLPYRTKDTWLALEIVPGYDLDEDRVLFTAHYADEPLLGTKAHCGLLLDEWTELLPAAEETTGLTFHYDRPDSEPPQVMLLVVPPQPDKGWRWNDLVAAIHETYDLAKSRAVEPQHLDGTAYAQLLPATVLAATNPPITISTDLAANNLRGRADA